MTIDQDTPVAASQPATETPSQEAPKPRRTTRAKAKTTAKAPSAKSTASKAADAAPAGQSAETRPPQASPEEPKTTAKKPAGSAKRAVRTTKTARTSTAASKKSETILEAEAAASDAKKAAAKPKTTRTAAKSGATGRTAKAATAGKTKAATAKKAESDASAVTEDAAARAKAPTEKKTAAKTTRSRSAKSGATAKSRATAKNAPADAAATPPATAPAQPEAAPTAVAPAQRTDRAPQAPTPAAPQPAAAKAAPQQAETAGSPVVAVAAATAATVEAAPVKEISPSRPEAQRTSRPEGPVDQPPAAKPQQAAVTATAPTGEPTRETADETAGEATGETVAAGEPSSEDAPRRKNRRGRRGGRGRNRKKEQNGQDAAPNGNAAESAEKTVASDATPGAMPGVMEEDAVEARAQVEAKPAAPRKQGRPEPAPSAKAAKAPAESSSKGRRRMFISVLPGEQVEVALAEDGQLLEYYLDMLHQRKIKGNIYKGVIHNIDTNLQAAFVSYGSGKNGFLQIDEVHPEYWLAHHEPSKGKKFPPIQKVLKAGQEVLVQVVKEPTGSKGAFLTTWLSLAGRFLVLTPGQDQIGVSRKVDDDDERSRLREMMNGIDPGQGLGVIVRTVSAGTTKTTLKNDLQYLKRVWRDIRKKATEVSAPSLIYQEPGLSERAVRDYLTEDVSEIWVDNEDVAQSVRETVSLLFPRRKDLVRVHTDLRTPMWERFNLRRQLEQIYSREVLLPSGGRLVFDQTEALMAIDINSGKISGKGNFEAMAHKTNMEAAEAIARHLKLRDIGGQVVIDFIEMRDKKHVLEVEKTLRTAMKNDRARHDVARMSSFGLLELVRQRTGSSALAISLEPCPACGGTGMRRNIEWQSLQALRELRRMMNAESKEKCVYTASPELALYLLNHKRDTLREIEQDYGKCLEILVRP